MLETAVKVDCVEKKYVLYKTNMQTLAGELFNSKKGREIVALENISFEIKTGERVAIMGRVGSGRTTLMKIIAGVVSPSSGKVFVNGERNVVLDVKAGFDKEFTGRENLYIKNAYMGKTKQDIKAKENEIIDFSELGELLDLPMKSYPAGMAAKLGFSMCLAFDADVFLVDDPLSVGDTATKMKCIEKINEVVSRNNATLIIVTNRAAIMEKLCDRAIILNEGELVFDGEPREAIDYYKKNIKKKYKVKESYEEFYDNESYDNEEF